MRVRAAIRVPADPDTLWRALVRWEEQPRWMRDADRVWVLTPRREGTGTRIAVRTRVLAIPLFTEELEVVAWDPPNRLVLRHLGFVRGLGVWELHPEASTTRFAWTEDLSIGVPGLGALALRAYRPFLRAQMRRGLEDLRAILTSP